MTRSLKMLWKKVSFPRASFDDPTWGKVSQVKLRIIEYNPNQDYAQNVYFDDICFKP